MTEAIKRTLRDSAPMRWLVLVMFRFFPVPPQSRDQVSISGLFF